ncbi:NADH:ubiquinone oxidoreductase [Rhodosalinus sp. FB01]|uniref:NADH:ubiquinone oxidoreductase n=1 Tax=Rhodosalinus sp. FB01 TaxID=3239194 RepID=UPI0035249583
MTTSSKDDTCLKFCWGLAAVAGLGMVVALNDRMWFLVALVLGGAFGAGMGVVLQRKVCGILGNPLEDTTLGELTGMEPLRREKLEALDMAETEAPAPRHVPPASSAPASAAPPAAKAAASTAAPKSAGPEESAGKAGAAAAKEAAGAGGGTKPATLSAPRGGQADDLKKIKGVGPKLETLLNSLGFYHFDQIAAWSEDEIAWVDENLEGFKGRVTRDDWVAQAKDLAAAKSD